MIVPPFYELVWPHWVLCAVWGATLYKRHQTIRVNPKGRRLKWWKFSRARITSSGWGHLVCPGWRCWRGDLIAVHGFLTGIGRIVGWGASDWTLGKGFTTSQWLVRGTVSPEIWTWHQACSRRIWIMLIVIWFSCRQSFEELDVGVHAPYGSLPAQHYFMILYILHFVWELCCCDDNVRVQAASSCKVEECLCETQYSSNYMISVSIFLLP